MLGVIQTAMGKKTGLIPSSPSSLTSPSLFPTSDALPNSILLL